MTIVKQDNKSAVKIFAVLDVLWLNFAVGFTQTEIREATGLSATLVHRYIKTLIEVGYAEEINGTKRYRPSHRLAHRATLVLHSLNEIERNVKESINRLNRR